MNCTFESDLPDPNSTDAFISDDKFLVRCASTYNWEPLVERCQAIVDIFTLVNLGESTELQEQKVAASEKQLLAFDEWGNTALHLSCYHSPPLQVVVSLLNAADKANPPIQLAPVKCHDRSTPLLVACATGASVEIIQALLDAPGGGLQVTIVDVQGDTPVSYLCLQYETKASNSMYCEDFRPLHLIDLTLVNYTDPTSDDYSALFESFWNKVNAITRAIWPIHGSFTSILHGCSIISETVPPKLSDLICHNFSHISSAPADDGSLPLHLAIAPRQFSDCELKRIHYRAYFIARFLKGNSNATKIAVPGTCRTPFCQAVASGLQWHCFKETDECDSATQISTPIEVIPSGPLKSIWECAPEAIHTRDIVTGLYPFLLAASIHNNVDTTFCLLRLYPQVLQDLVAPSSES